MKYIQKKIVSELPKTVGSITDTLNVEDKSRNAPSINLVQMMAGVPTEGIIAYETEDGSIPEGYEEVENPDLVVYSTEEIIIGTWIDGKPLYRKVFYIQLATSTDKSVAEVRTNVASLNIDKVTRFDGTIQQSNFAVFPANFVYLGSGLNDYFFGLLNYDSATKEIQIRHNADWLSGQYENVILEYTKTTD